MSITESEIFSQPEIWERAVALLPSVSARLPKRGARVAVIGCGTSYYIAQAVAALREGSGHGETDAFAASEAPVGRSYDEIVAISRSGTTTEVIQALAAIDGRTRTLAVCAVPGTPITAAAADSITLAAADEDSIVQSRFATSVLTLLRAHCGGDVAVAVADARAALDSVPAIDPTEFEQFVFLGTNWTVGLANEAALKFRETSLSWAESYAATEYRHGPISTAGAGALVWLLGVDDEALCADITATGATVYEGPGDPQAQLVRVHRAAVALALARGLDPDRPQHLSRSVVLQ